MNAPRPSPARSTLPARLRLEALEAREVPAMVGTLDPAFGSGGLVSIPSNINVPGGQAVAVDGLGRTVFASNARTLQVTRVNPDGSPDSSFGTGGTLDLGSISSFDGTSVTFDASGDIVILCGGNVTRLTPTGALDTTFGAGGTVSLGSANFGANQGGAVAVDAAGNIVVAGESQQQDALAVARLTHTGALDPAFNGGAVAVIAGVTGGAYSHAVTIDHAGRIVVAGGGGGVNSEWAVARLNPDGSPDTSFAGTGSKLFEISSNSVGIATGVAADPVGNIVLAGNDGGRAEVVKLTAAGGLDPAFGSGGAFVAPIGSAPGAFTPVGLLVLANGDIVAAATTEDTRAPHAGRFGVFELTPAGALDPSFNPNGPIPGANVFAFGAGANPQVVGVALSTSGNILVGGFDNTLSGSIELARLFGTAPADAFGGLKGQDRVAVGDVNGDGTPDLVYVTGPGTPLRLAVVNGADHLTLLVPPVDPFGDNFTGGGYVAVGDFDHSGRDQIVVAADQGGSSRVVVWSLLPDGQLKQQASFFGMTGDPNFRGGTRIAVGDVNGDGTPDLVVAAGYGGGPRATVFDGKTILSGTPTKLVNDFFVFQGPDQTSLRNGTYVAVGDVNGDGYGDLIFGAGPGGGPRVLVLSGKLLVQNGPSAALAAPLSNFFVGGTDTTRTGMAVAVTTVARDGVADIAAGSPPGTIPVPTSGQSAKVSVYAGSALTAGTPPTPAMTIDPAADIVLAGVFVG